MEERIVGMVRFLSGQIDVLAQMEQSQHVRDELTKWSGVAGACHQLVPDQRFLDIIAQVNDVLFPKGERRQGNTVIPLRSPLGFMCCVPQPVCYAAFA